MGSGGRRILTATTSTSARLPRSSPSTWKKHSSAILVAHHDQKLPWPRARRSRAVCPKTPHVATFNAIQGATVAVSIVWYLLSGLTRECPRVPSYGARCGVAQVTGRLVHTVLVSAAELLFAAGDLSSVLDGRQREAARAVEAWEPEELLVTAEADIVRYLVDRYSLACPRLHRDQIEQLPVAEEVERARGAWSGQTYERRQTKIVIVVPFDGERDVFKFRPSTYSLNPPRAVVGEGELSLTWVGEGSGTNPVSIRQHFDNEFDKIEQQLSVSCRDIDQYNARLRTLVTSAVAGRRAKLLADRNLEAGIGYPVRQRPDAAKYSVPVARRKIVTPERPVARGPFRPEPVLPEAQYDQALAVLRNARNALERTPSMTAHLNEEKIRDLLLVFLNAQFEGAAAGEVFNAAGKTDILIRAGDRNVFIAECKIWKSPKTVQDALTQLLSYLVWRDTKAALLVFIRSGEPTAIIEKAIAEIKKHPNFKRIHGTGETGERYDFVLHANGDPNQEIRLAFLPFAMQDAPAPSE